VVFARVDDDNVLLQDEHPAGLVTFHWYATGLADVPHMGKVELLDNAIAAGEHGTAVIGAIELTGGLITQIVWVAISNPQLFFTCSVMV